MNEAIQTAAGSTDNLVEYGIGRVALGDIIRRSARRFGGKPAVRARERTITFRELDDDTNRFANYLLSLGLAAGSRVATLCLNSVDLLVAIYGINKAGLVWVPINVSLAAEEVSYILGHADVSVIVADEQLASRPGFAATLEARAAHVLHISTAASDAGFRTALARHAAHEPQVSIHERDLAMIMYTSGTTSRPKGVMHCHLAIYFAALGNIGEWSVTRNDHLMIALPLFHCAAHIMITTFLAAGAGVVLRSSFDCDDVLHSIAHERVSVLIALPMQYAALFEHPRRAATDLTSLRLCIYVMTPMPRTLLPGLIESFCPNFALTMGQTEMYPMTMMFRPEQQLRRFGSYWGESATLNDTALMDEDGRLLGIGEVGEVVHRGPNVMLGYFRDPEATAAVRKFGWHHTGDLAMLDEDGQILFIDRKKDMIKSGGENVSSIQVEEVLLRHPAVGNGAVIGLPHLRWGEAVTAFVTLKPGAVATEEEIMAHCRTHLGGFQSPKCVIILESLPMTGSGKVRKVDLRITYADWFESR